MNPRISLIILLTTTVAALTACSPVGRVHTASGNDITTDGRELPHSFRDQSVNNGVARINSQSELELSISEGANTEGGFNGRGTGNRAIVGLTQFHERKLATINKITLQAVVEGTEKLSLLLLIDPRCDNNVRVFSALVANGQSNVGLDQPSWRVTGVDPIRNETQEIVVATEAPMSLTKFLADFPDACLRNTDSRDDGLPKIPTAAVLIALGSNQSITSGRTLIQRIEIGESIFDRSTWESR